MSNQDRDELRLVTDAVNAHGIFFKRAVRRTLEQLPNVRILGEEYPVNYLEGASLDLLVGYTSKTDSWVLPVECKKAFVSAKRWIFFEDPAPPLKLIHFFQGSGLHYLRISNHQALRAIACIEGIEIDMQKLKRSDQLYKSGQVDPVWKAAFQVCKGGQGFLLNEFKARQKYPEAPYIDYCSMPLIITNAPLSVCELNSQSVDILSGTHQGNMVLKTVPWLVLFHPFTPTQALGVEHLETVFHGYQPPEDRGAESKIGIVVLNSGHIADFFEMLSGIYRTQ